MPSPVSSTTGPPPRWAGTASSASLVSCFQGQATPPPCEGTCASRHADTYAHVNVFNSALFGAHTHIHTHAQRDKPLCMQLSTHSLMTIHICPCASTSTHRHMHTPMGRHLCKVTPSDTHTDTHNHTPMCMNLFTCSLSQTHPYTRPCACTYPCVHAHRRTYTHVSYV